MHVQGDAQRTGSFKKLLGHVIGLEGSFPTKVATNLTTSEGCSFKETGRYPRVSRGKPTVVPLFQLSGKFSARLHFAVLRDFEFQCPALIKTSEARGSFLLV